MRTNSLQRSPKSTHYSNLRNQAPQPSAQGGGRREGLLHQVPPAREPLLNRPRGLNTLQGSWFRQRLRFRAGSGQNSRGKRGWWAYVPRKTGSKNDAFPPVNPSSSLSHKANVPNSAPNQRTGWSAIHLRATIEVIMPKAPTRRRRHKGNPQPSATPTNGTTWRRRWSACPFCGSCDVHYRAETPFYPHQSGHSRAIPIEHQHAIPRSGAPRDPPDVIALALQLASGRWFLQYFEYWRKSNTRVWQPL